MRTRLAVILAILIATPLALLAWIGARGVRDEREAVASRVEALLGSRLRDVASRIEDLLASRARELERDAESLPLDAESIRAWLRRNPLVSQAFVLGADGTRLHPPPEGPITEGERDFLDRAGQIWRDRDRFFRTPEGGQPAGGGARAGGASSSPSPSTPARAPAGGWYSWYQGGDLSLLWWRHLESGPVLGVEVNRSRFLADAVAVLPSGETVPPEPGASRTRLIDSRGEILHQWGVHAPAPGESPAAELRLAPPLSAWSLQHFAAGEPLAASVSRTLRTQLVIGLSALGLVLAGLGAWFWRESSRDLRDARRRVTFVNQVSHELKTPLTNIRMYGELLQETLDADDERAREYLDTIVLESQRLSRLIGNVLTFARQQREALRLHRRPGVVDETLSAVVDRFRPLLAAKGVDIRFQGGAGRRVELDPDALEQIANNLLGNVEKYAPGSGAVDVTSRQDSDRTTVVVADRGPGIPERHREDVFQPFRRLSDRLNEGVSGTGLGLSIARELARLHGGDVRLLESELGAAFEVTLKTPGEAP